MPELMQNDNSGTVTTAPDPAAALRWLAKFLGGGEASAQQVPSSVAAPPVAPVQKIVAPPASNADTVLNADRNALLQIGVQKTLSAPAKDQPTPAEVAISASLPAAQIASNSVKTAAETSAESVLPEAVQAAKNASTFTPLSMEQLNAIKIDPSTLTRVGAASSAPAAVEEGVRQAFAPQVPKRTNTFGDTMFPPGEQGSTWEKVRSFMSNPVVPMAALFGMGFFAGDVGGGLSGLSQGFARGMAAMGEGVKAQKEREMEENTQNIEQQKANTAQISTAATLASKEKLSYAELDDKRKQLVSDSAAKVAALGLDSAKAARDATNFLVSFQGDMTKVQLALDQSFISDYTKLKYQEIQNAHDLDSRTMGLKLYIAGATAAQYAPDPEKFMQEFFEGFDKFVKGSETVVKPLPVGTTKKKEASPSLWERVFGSKPSQEDTRPGSISRLEAAEARGEQLGRENGAYGFKLKDGTFRQFTALEQAQFEANFAGKK